MSMQDETIAMPTLVEQFDLEVDDEIEKFALLSDACFKALQQDGIPITAESMIKIADDFKYCEYCDMWVYRDNHNGDSCTSKNCVEQLANDMKYGLDCDY